MNECAMSNTVRRSEGYRGDASFSLSLARAQSNLFSLFISRNTYPAFWWSNLWNHAHEGPNHVKSLHARDDAAVCFQYCMMAHALAS
jgi:hypothetical protein